MLYPVPSQFSVKYSPNVPGVPPLNCLSIPSGTSIFVGGQYPQIKIVPRFGLLELLLLEESLLDELDGEGEGLDSELPDESDEPELIDEDDRLLDNSDEPDEDEESVLEEDGLELEELEEDRSLEEEDDELPDGTDELELSDEDGTLLDDSEEPNEDEELELEEEGLELNELDEDDELSDGTDELELIDEDGELLDDSEEPDEDEESVLEEEGLELDELEDDSSPDESDDELPDESDRLDEESVLGADELEDGTLVPEEALLSLAEESELLAVEGALPLDSLDIVGELDDELELNGEELLELEEPGPDED